MDIQLKSQFIDAFERQVSILPEAANAREAWHRLIAKPGAAECKPLDLAQAFGAHFKEHGKVRVADMAGIIGQAKGGLESSAAVKASVQQFEHLFASRVVEPVSEKLAAVSQRLDQAARGIPKPVKPSNNIFTQYAKGFSNMSSAGQVITGSTLAVAALSAYNVLTSIPTFFQRDDEGKMKANASAFFFAAINAGIGAASFLVAHGDILNAAKAR